MNAPKATSSACAASPSRSSISTANSEKQDPPIIIKCGGPQRERSWADTPCQQSRRQKRKAGSPDHHQMRWATEGDILAEDPVRDVVEWKPDHGVQSAACHEHPADRRIPVVRDA